MSGLQTAVKIPPSHQHTILPHRIGQKIEGKQEDLWVEVRTANREQKKAVHTSKEKKELIHYFH